MAITFNGNCYFTGAVPLAPAYNAAKTIFLRYNLGSLTGSNQAFFNVTDGTSNAYQLGLRASYIGLWNFGGGWVVDVANPALNTWIPLCYTYDGSSVSNLYLSGTLVATSTVAVQTGSISGAVCQIGGNQWSEYPNSWFTRRRAFIQPCVECL